MSLFLTWITQRGKKYIEADGLLKWLRSNGLSDAARAIETSFTKGQDVPGGAS